MPNTDWKQIDRDILSRIDFAAVARELGVKLAKDTPGPGGWLECHAIDREDNDPSAAICVASENGSLGKYKDLGAGGKAIGFYDWTAPLLNLSDWRACREHWAKRVGVELPAGKKRGRPAKPKTLAESLQRLELGGLAALSAECGSSALVEACTAAGCTMDDQAAIDRHVLATWASGFCEAKGVTPDAILAAGGRPALWRPPGKDAAAVRVIAFPAYRPSDWEKPCGMLLLRCDAQLFEPLGKLRARKQHTLGGGVDGLVVLGGRERLEASHTVILTEGPTDALALHPLAPEGYCVATNICGAGSFDLNMAPAFAGKRVWVCMDRDKAGVSGVRRRVELLTQARFGVTEVRNVELPYAVADNHGKDVRDFLAEGGTFERLIELAEATPPETVGRPTIELTFEERTVNDLAIDALARREDVFARDGRLVTVHRREEAGDLAGIYLAAGTPVVAELSPNCVRELLADSAVFFTTRETSEGVQEVRQRVPKWCFLAIRDRGHWPTIRTLFGIAPCPFLRADGSICSTPGYDRATGVFLADAAGGDVPEHPTRDDALAAAAKLLDLVCDFPFAKDVHRVAWLAAVLTPMARNAYRGATPATIVDAAAPGTGKTLLVDVAAIIASGRDMPRTPCPSDDQEARKVVTSVLTLGNAQQLFDNLPAGGSFGTPSLDAALTATEWTDRALGSNRMVHLPMRTQFWASGNNLSLGAETARRIMHVRIEALVDKPEARSDFKYPNLLATVRDRRGELLSACLTVLRAFYVAGRPSQGLKPWGSFEGWSSIVREALVWLGLPDPAESRVEIAASGDVAKCALAGVLETWPTVNGEPEELTAADIGERVAEVHDRHASPTTAAKEFAQAVCELVPPPKGKGLPNAFTIGNRLNKHRRQVVDGQYLDYRSAKGRKRYWTARKIAESTPNNLDEQARGDTGDTGDTFLLRPIERDKKIHSEGGIYTGAYRDGVETASPVSPVSPQGRKLPDGWVEVTF